MQIQCAGIRATAQRTQQGLLDDVICLEEADVSLERGPRVWHSRVHLLQPAQSLLDAAGAQRILQSIDAADRILPN